MELIWFLASFLLLATSSFAGHQETEQGLNHSTLHLKLYHVRGGHDARKSHLFGPNFFSTPVKAASLNTYNYYVDIGLGTPPKYYSVVIDTGSSFTWVQCHEHGVGVFNPSASRTYKKLPCSNTQCNSLEGATQNHGTCTSLNECKYKASYADDSFSVGYLSQDTLTLTQSETLPGFVYGCGLNIESQIVLFGRTTGLVGLARNNLSMISQLSARYGHDFSYCLPTQRGGSGGSLSIGKDSLTGPSYNFTPMLPNCPDMDSNLYYLRLSAIVVAGKTVMVAQSQYCNTPTVIDSGTEVTRLPTLVYADLRDEFKRIMSSKNKTIRTFSDHHFLDTCYEGSLKEMSSYVPEIRMVFQGEAELTLAPQNILVEGNEEGTLCLAFADNSHSHGYVIIGSVQQQTYSVAYDVSNSRIGFAAGGCT
ncbi:aspartyl protease family protein At5g10770-like [Cornus florida]|uniref:aspartyl protease family protein At5g10770-like n=1 Tax=Cornus florida TaxID=4283 RepID=UPI00289E3B16|nr:aspartyl protease family protein At5g10770-like [Cornus florida]